MPSPTPAQCRDQLASMLAEQNSQLATLETLLTREYQLLKDKDVESLDQAGAARQQCVGRLMRIEDERRALCRMLGHGEDRNALLNLVRWCDPQGVLQPALQEYRDRTIRCREQNDRNGMLVNARLRHLSTMLNVLDGGGAKEGHTYGPGGAKPRRSSRMLATRA